jgi:hypothetical protein
MFNGVIMDIIHVPSPVLFVTKEMLPEASLPNVLLVTLVNWLILCDGKVSFDQSPTSREIGIARGQLPDTMEMIRQDDHSFYGKRVLVYNMFERLMES